MDELVGAYIVRFGGFRFDRSRGLLACQNDDGTLAPVTIGSRALDILGLLIDPVFGRKWDPLNRG